MTTKTQQKYTIGDRVADRPSSNGIFTFKKEVHARIAQYRKPRYGTVVDMIIKPNRNGSKRKYLVIQWDHLQSPTEHAQMRICLASEFAKLQAEGYGFEVE